MRVILEKRMKTEADTDQMTQSLISKSYILIVNSSQLDK